MRRSRTTFVFLAFLLSCIASILPGCGSSSAGKVVSITVTPSPVSLAYGQHGIVLTATAVNGSNATVSTTFTFASSNTAAISVAPTGEVCGGTWDANFVTCSKPASLTPQTATITVTAQNVIRTVQAFVHEKVDSVMISGFRPPQGTSFSSAYPGIGVSGSACATSTSCICTPLATVFGYQVGSTPSTSLPQFQAKAISNDPTVCVPPKTAAPCDITADLTAGNSSVSPFQWSSSDTTVATIDTTGTATAGTVTPVGTGQASISASTAGVNGPSVPFVTCPVTSITLTATNEANGALTISPGGTQTLTVTATDTTNATVTYSTSNTTNLALNYPGLSWLSSDLYTVTAAPQTTSVNTTTPSTSNSTSGTGSNITVSGSAGNVTVSQTVPEPTATATGVTDGVAALVTSCTPPACNKNLFPVYSNPILTTNSGSNVGTAYVASAQSQFMLALDLATGTFLQSYTLPSTPNSFLFNRQGTKGILGSASGVFVFDSVTGVLQPLGFNGTVLSISPDGSLAAVFGQVAGSNQDSIGIVNLLQDTLVTSFPIPGKVTDTTQPSVAADFSIDSRYLWVAVNSTAGNRVYVYTSGVGSTFYTASSAVSDLAFLASGPLVYLAGDTSAASVTARATCLGGQQNAFAGGTNLANGIVDVQAGVAPSNIRALPSGAGILALDPPNNIDVVTLANSPPTTLAGCPPAPQSGAVDNPIVQNSLGLGITATALNQFLVTRDSSTAVLTSTGNNVTLVSLANLQALTATTVPLQNSATLFDSTTNLTFKGDVPASSGEFVVGGSDDNLHVISFSAGTDTAIGVSGLGLTNATTGAEALPNLVAIRNQ
jgi:hypothetical protein